MKIIKTYTILLVLISVVACSKKPSSDNNTKFPDNIAGTWSRSVIDASKSSDTATDKNTGQKWVKDIVVLTGNEAAKLQNLIQAVPQQTRNDFATTFKKLMNMLEKFASHSTSLYIKNTQEYKEFYSFFATYQNDAFPLVIGYLFNDQEIRISEVSVWGMGLCTEGRFENLKQEVANEIVARPYTDSGYKISYGDVSLHRRWAKKILNQL